MFDPQLSEYCDSSLGHDGVLAEEHDAHAVRGRADAAALVAADLAFTAGRGAAGLARGPIRVRGLDTRRSTLLDFADGAVPASDGVAWVVIVFGPSTFVGRPRSQGGRVTESRMDDGGHVVAADFENGALVVVLRQRETCAGEGGEEDETAKEGHF